MRIKSAAPSLIMLASGCGASDSKSAADKKRLQIAEETANRLSEEVETIKKHLPDQSHAMQDVGYHFSNLWFAGQKQHWDLADFIYQRLVRTFNGPFA